MGLKCLPERFFDQCRATPAESAFYYFDQAKKTWTEMTWSEYCRQVQVVAGWLRAQGVAKGDRIAILSANRPEWMITDLAILSLGAVSVPIYATSAPADIRYVLEHSEAKFLFADMAERTRAAGDQALDGVILFDDDGQESLPSGNRVTTWQDILSSDVAILPEPIPVADDDLSTIIYTSGTTGRPKGVMHTHGTFRAAMKEVVPILELGKDRKGDRFFSFLPLSHVAERVLVQLGSVYTGSEVAFARSVANLAEDLVHCCPTILLCVPRLWEKMYEKITAGVGRAPATKKMIFNLARRLGACRVEGRSAHRTHNKRVGAIISDKLVGKALREKLGLDRTRMLLTGSAPTRTEVMKFFASFGLFIREVYGLTENLGLGVLNDNDHIVFGSCGKPFSGNELRLAPDKEILFRAPWTFKGYYKDEGATKEVLSPDGWFATGDLGSVDSDGYLRIVGRKKELLKTSTGKYVAPVPIEDKLKALPLIADAMVVGDNEKYCVAVVSLEEEQQAMGEMSQSILDHLKAVNQELASHESIKRVGILDHGFSVEDGTLTPTLKLKRKVAADKHATFIAEIYQASDMLVYQTKR